jgi:hypothetical protein
VFEHLVYYRKPFVVLLGVGDEEDLLDLPTGDFMRVRQCFYW